MLAASLISGVGKLASRAPTLSAEILVTPPTLSAEVLAKPCPVGGGDGSGEPVDEDGCPDCDAKLAQCLRHAGHAESCRSASDCHLQRVPCEKHRAKQMRDGCANANKVGSPKRGARSPSRLAFNATWWLGSARCTAPAYSPLAIAPISYTSVLGKCTHMNDFNVTNATTSEVHTVEVYVIHNELEKQPAFYMDSACTHGDEYSGDFIEGDAAFATDGSCNGWLEFSCGRVASLEIQPASAAASAVAEADLALWKRVLGHDATPGATPTSVKIVAL